MTPHQISGGRAMPPGSLFGMYLGGITVCLAGNLLARLAERGGWLPPGARIAVAVVAVVPLAVAAVMFWRLLRSALDEMLQRIILEGLAFALVVFIPLAALYVNLRTAGAWTPRLDPADILLAPAVLVAIGIGIAWRKVQ